MRVADLCKEAHRIAVEKGFYERDNITVPELLMLTVTELGEACEADRCGQFDKRREEIADVFIRLADTCEYLHIDIEDEIQKKMEKNKSRPYKHGKRY